MNKAPTADQIIRQAELKQFIQDYCRKHRIFRLTTFRDAGQGYNVVFHSPGKTAFRVAFSDDVKFEKTHSIIEQVLEPGGFSPDARQALNRVVMSYPLCIQFCIEDGVIRDFTLVRNNFP